MSRTHLAKRKTPRFTYSDVVVSDQRKCEDAIDRIFGYQRRMASDVVAIGCLLIDVKEKLEHGQFGAWVKHYFGWSQQTVSNMMRAGETFGKVPNFGDLTIDTSALYLLASMSCPDDLREDIIKRASKGERITHATVREALDELSEDDAEPVAPPVTRHAPSDRRDETIVIGEEEDDQVEEPAPSRYQSQPFVDDEGEQETEREVLEWSLFGFMVSARRMVADWRDRCPEEERGEMAKVLRDLAEQIENASPRPATRVGRTKCDAR